MPHPICLGITGASGAIYAVRLLEVLRASGRDVHLSISQSGRDVIEQELDVFLDLQQFDAESLLRASTNDANNRERTGIGSGTTNWGQLIYYHCQDLWLRWPAARSSPAEW